MFLGPRPLPLAGLVVLRTGELQTVLARWRLCRPVQVQLGQTMVTAVTIHIRGTTFPGARRRDASRSCLVLRGRSGGDGGVRNNRTFLR